MRPATLGLLLPGMPFLRMLMLTGAFLVSGVAAQMRALPADAERGYVRHVREMLIEIDGRQVVLSPAATIRDRLNLIIVPVALPAEGALAEYLIGADGQVQRIWLLTPEEAAMEKKKPLPAAR